MGDGHARASGKLLLSMSTPAEIESYLRKHPIRALTAKTIKTRAELEDHLPRIREDLISYDREEYAIGLSCLAVPLGALPAQLVLSISAPTERFLERSEFYAEALRGIASKNQLGSDDR